MIDMIPELTYETRCKYCDFFRADAENRIFENEEIYMHSVKKPCAIQSIAVYPHECEVVDNAE